MCPRMYSSCLLCLNLLLLFYLNLFLLFYLNLLLLLLYFNLRAHVTPTALKRL